MTLIGYPMHPRIHLNSRRPLVVENGHRDERSGACIRAQPRDSGAGR